MSIENIESKNAFANDNVNEVMLKQNCIAVNMMHDSINEIKTKITKNENKHFDNNIVINNRFELCESFLKSTESKIIIIEEELETLKQLKNLQVEFLKHQRNSTAYQQIICLFLGGLLLLFVIFKIVDLVIFGKIANFFTN